MSPKRAKTSRKPRGAQKWILAELRSLDSGATLSTSKIAKRIAKSSGKKYHMLSVYGALRSTDGALTVVAINKTTSAIQTSLTLANVATVAEAPEPLGA